MRFPTRVATLSAGLIVAATVIAPGPAQAAPDVPGSPDPAFAQTGTGLNGFVMVVAAQPDGKVLAGGSFTQYNGTAAPGIIRLNSDGTRDNTFAQTGTGLNGVVKSIALQSNGKILVGGDFSQYNGVAAPRIIRLNSDGTRDDTFAQTGTGLGTGGNSAWAMALQSDGKILVGGDFTVYDGVSAPRLIRLNADGTRDSGFTQSGTGLGGTVRAVAVASDGGVIVGGGFQTYNSLAAPFLMRLNSDGTRDASFAQSGTGLDGTVRGLTMVSDGKVVAVGSFSAYNGAEAKHLIRLNSGGTRDMTFAQTTGLNGPTMSVALQGEKLIIGGQFGSAGGSYAPYVARMNSDGTRDLTFRWATTDLPILAGLNSMVYSVAVAADAKVLVGGVFTSYNGVAMPYVARLLNASQEISFDALADRPISDGSFTASATASSGLAVTFTTTTPSVCTSGGTNGATITLVARGTCTVRASQAGNVDAGHTAAADVDRSFSVTGTAQTITFGALADVLVSLTSSPVQAALSASASSGLPISYTTTTPGVCYTSSATLYITAAGTCTVVAAQAGNSEYSAAASVERTFAVNKHPQTMVFSPSTVFKDYIVGETMGVSARTNPTNMVATFSTTTPSVCTVSPNNGIVETVAAGTCKVLASHPGTEKYAAIEVERSFQVAPLNPAIPVMSRTGANVSWSAVAGGTQYYVMYRQSGSVQAWGVYAMSLNSAMFAPGTKTTPTSIALDNPGGRGICSAQNVANGFSTCPMPYGWQSKKQYDFALFSRNSLGKTSIGPVESQFTYTAP